MTTSENAAPAIPTVDQLPALPEGFHWLITSSVSTVDTRINQTRLWLRADEADSPEYNMDGTKIIAWANVTRGSAWIQDPTLRDLITHAESLLVKTSIRWTLGLPTDIPAPTGV